jgi:hypothetical protein
MMQGCKKEAVPTPVQDSSPIDLARRAERDGKPSEVRKLLEEGVRAGDALSEELRLVRGACKVQNDQACLADLKKLYR